MNELNFKRNVEQKERIKCVCLSIGRFCVKQQQNDTALENT